MVLGKKKDVMASSPTRSATEPAPLPPASGPISPAAGEATLPATQTNTALQSPTGDAVPTEPIKIKLIPYNPFFHVHEVELPLEAKIKVFSSFFGA